MISTCLPFVALFASFVSGFSRQADFTTLFPTTLMQYRRQQPGVSTSLSFVAGGVVVPMDAAASTTARARRTMSFPIPVVPRGGGGGVGSAREAAAANTPYDTGTKCPVTGLATVLSSLYATGGFVYILVKAIKRVLPIALEPFQPGAVRPLSQFELGAYIATCLWFAYVEGYKGFQQKFSPLVVKRSFTLIPGKNGTRWWHFFLAPFYSMGLIHATKKRQIVSWSVSIGVAAIVAAVKQLPYPWRNIVDAGVVVGLTWGSVSILVLYVKSWMTGEAPPRVDAALPMDTKQKAAANA